MMVSDGFGPASQTYARSFWQYKNKYTEDTLTSLDEILVGSSRTRSSSSLVTDSAAGATAFSCAKKSYNAAIGGVPGIFANCLAVNKNTGGTDWIPCSTQLPTVCFNSVMRRVLLFDDKSRQVKVNSPAGPIQGWRDQNAFRFLGIPFAEPP
ncbi:hypothetical protein BG011_003412, partial [Mortierella polycephala]